MLVLGLVTAWCKHSNVSVSPWIVTRVPGHPHSAQESTEMRSLHQRVKETKKFLSLSSSRLCLKGWGSSSLEILPVCSCADPGSSQLGTPVAKRCCRGFLEVYRVVEDVKARKVSKVYINVCVSVSVMLSRQVNWLTSWTTLWPLIGPGWWHLVNTYRACISGPEYSQAFH